MHPARPYPGQMVTTYGPWSNGHQNQVALVTNVYGSEYLTAGDTLVNLQIFVDEGMPMLQGRVKWCATREDAMTALAARHMHEFEGGAQICWPLERPWRTAE